MKEWWKKHNSVLPTMSEKQKNQVEDITGNIPLFLNILLKPGHKNFEEALGYLNDQLTLKIEEPMTSFSKKVADQDLYVFLVYFVICKLYEN